MWSTVREKVRQRSRTTEVMLAGATVRAVDGHTLVLSHESVPLAKRLNEQRNADVIREALQDALGVAWTVRCEPGGPAPAPESPPSPATDRRAAPPPPPPPPPAAPEERDERAEEESMLAEAAENTGETGPRRDPEEVALELLQNELGARKIEG